MKNKIKYWTACVNSGVSGSGPFVTYLGNPHTNLADAKRDKARLHSSNAAVVKGCELGDTRPLQVVG
jgi:hypothetical protein